MYKKISIIGGAGFIGTNLCRRLTEIDQDFEIIDLKISKQYSGKSKIGDVRKIQTLRETITGDLVINLAAVHRDDVSDISEYHDTNVNGAENIALVCSELKINKIVFTSSVAVYGFASPGTDETGTVKPFHAYGISKYEAEKKFCEWRARQNSSLIIIRPTVVFGEGNRGNVFNLFNQIYLDKFVMIGNGLNKKSIAYVGNLVSFLEMCISTELEFGIYNYVDTPDLTMNELVSIVRFKLKGKSQVGLRLPYKLALLCGYTLDFISRISGKKFPISVIRIKKFVASSEFTSAKSELGAFIAPHDLRKAIEMTLDKEFISPDSDREIFD